MKRIAIIIGNEGKMRNFLPEVSKDMTNSLTPKTEEIASRTTRPNDVSGRWPVKENNAIFPPPTAAH